MAAYSCSVYYMQRVTDGSSDDFCVDTVYIEDLNDIFDQCHTNGTDIIYSAQEGGNICSTCSCSHQRLCSGEDQCYVCFYAFCSQNFNCFQTFQSHGDFDNDVFVDFNQFSCFCYHTFMFQADNFCTDGAINDCCDFFYNFNKVSAFFCDQGGVCCYAANYAQVICFSDVVYISCVDEHFHGSYLSFLCLNNLLGLVPSAKMPKRASENGHTSAHTTLVLFYANRKRKAMII